MNSRIRFLASAGAAYRTARAGRDSKQRGMPLNAAACAIAVLGIAIGADARADDAARLPAVTVHGTATSEVAERLEREQAKDVRDVLGREVNADVGGGVRQGQRIFLRGVEGTNVNITVDGARQGQNLYNHRGGLGNVDPDILKQVEIRPGPPAADDGHGALGGSIRMETVDAQDLLAPGQQLSARLYAGYASADEGARGSISAYGLVGKGVGLLGHFSRSNYEDLRVGGGERTPYSGGEDEGYLLKLSMLEAGPHKLRIGSERNEASGLNFQQRGDYPWQFQPVNLTSRPPVDQTLTREQHTLDYRFDPASPLVDLKLRLYQSSNEWRGRTPPPNLFVEGFDSNGQGADLRNTFGYGGERWRGGLTLGVDYLDDEGINRRSDRPSRGNRYDNTGIYAQNRLNADSGDVWFGVRHDDFGASFRDGTTRTNNDATSFNLGGEVRLDRGISLFAGYGEAARGAGTIPVHFAGNIVAGGALINGRANGELKPERSRQGEAGLRWQQGAEGSDGRLRAEVLAFQNRIGDAILFAQPGTGGLGGRPVTELYNADKTAAFKGYELRAGYTIGPLRADLSFMHLDTKDLPELPQFLARFGAPHGDKAVLNLVYAVWDNLELGYTATAVAGLDEVPANQTVYIEKPGYTTHDLFIGWQPRDARGLSLEFAARNLFDKRYSRHSTLSEVGLSTLDPGRDFRVGVRYVF
ncbi:MAG: TonB-dependent receptor domain-containing protein [Thiotrichales bacterium]